MLEQAIIISLIAYAVNVLFQEGMIFGKVGYWIENKLPMWIYKPLIGCTVCMSPYYGIAYIGFMWSFMFNFSDTAIILLISIGTSRLLVNLTNNL